MTNARGTGVARPDPCSEEAEAGLSAGGGGGDHALRVEAGWGIRGQDTDAEAANAATALTPSPEAQAPLTPSRCKCPGPPQLSL